MAAKHDGRSATRSKTRVSRREVLAAAAGGGAVTLAGCTGDGGDGGGGDGDGGGGSGGGSGGGTVDTVKIGSTVPLSGPYGTAGKAIRNLLELAGQ
jgi:ABC-type branched-subunit amino acid transport system substrate-binding protein